jgi:hypothetical protein
MLPRPLVKAGIQVIVVRRDTGKSFSLQRSLDIGSSRSIRANGDINIYDAQDRSRSSTNI